ncbi:MAG TPA: hypothetical protein VJB87_04930 [Candidatus Nanoarchaeia archaeon]|nr:hypothetical protein [Candidatus Nanoarchaeia archaeon]
MTTTQRLQEKRSQTLDAIIIYLGLPILTTQLRIAGMTARRSEAYWQQQEPRRNNPENIRHAGMVNQLVTAAWSGIVFTLAENVYLNSGKPWWHIPAALAVTNAVDYLWERYRTQ